MSKSLLRAVSAFAACICVLSVILAIVNLVRMPSGMLHGYWHTEFARQVYVGGFVTLLVIAALAMLVAIGAHKLGTTNEACESYLIARLTEMEKKIDDKQKEIDILRKKIDGLRKETHP